MAERKYTQTQVKRRKEVQHDGETYIRFLGVLRYSEPNPDFIEKPEGKDTRTAKQKRKTVWKEVTKTLEALKVTKGRKSQQKKDEETEHNITIALETWRNEMESEQESGARESAADMFTTDYVDQYIRQLQDGGIIEASTVRDYLMTAKRLREHFGSIKLCDLDPSDIQRWEADKRKSGSSASVVGKCHRLLKSACKRAVELGDLDHNPLDKVKPPKREKKRPNALDREGREHLTSILADMEPTVLVVGAQLSMYTGLRRGELCALRWRDIDLDNAEIHVQAAIGLGNEGTYEKTPKTGSSTRTVPISPTLDKVLRQRKTFMQSQCLKAGVSAYGADFSKLFVLGDITGRYCSVTVLSRDWTSFAKMHNIMGNQGERLTLHGLRHSYATAAIEAGADVKSVSDNLGHSNTSITLDVYASATRDGKRRATELVEEAFNPKPADIIDLDKNGTEDE